MVLPNEYLNEKGGYDLNKNLKRIIIEIIDFCYFFLKGLYQAICQPMRNIIGINNIEKKSEKNKIKKKYF